MKVKVKKIDSTKDITTKDGRTLKKTTFLSEDDQILNTFSSVEVGQEYEGDIKEDNFGKQFTKIKSGGFRSTFSPEYLEKKNELNARQTALNNAVAMAVGRLTANENIEKGAEIKQAEVYLKWLKGGKVNGSSTKPKEEEPNEPVKVVEQTDEEEKPKDDIDINKVMEDEPPF